MHWDDDARSAVAKAPFFVRGLITKRVEDHVRGLGRDAVTLADVTQLRASVKGTGGGNGDEQSQWGGISAEQIEEIVRASRPRVFADERTYEVRTCAVCPRSIFDVESIAGKMVGLIEEARVPEAVTSRVRGPILRHHRFSVSISGCVNSCSQPQIVDFGVQGRARPVRGLGGCTGCGKCVNACREGAVVISQKEPLIAPAGCVDCGDCAAVCPTQALEIDERGFTILVGGRLGRRPRLAQTLFDFADEKKLLTAFRVTCEVFAGEMGPDERLGDAIERIGIREIARRCVSTTSC